MVTPVILNLTVMGRHDEYGNKLKVTKSPAELLTDKDTHIESIQMRASNILIDVKEQDNTVNSVNVPYGFVGWMIEQYNTQAYKQGDKPVSELDYKQMLEILSNTTLETGKFETMPKRAQQKNQTAISRIRFDIEPALNELARVREPEKYVNPTYVQGELHLPDTSGIKLNTADDDMQMN